MYTSVRRVALLTGLVTLSLVSAPMALPWAQAGDLPVNADTLVRHVRQALGRGAVARARALATGTEAPAETRTVAGALVDLFEGRFAEARAALAPLQDPDGLLELGLLDLAEGRRAEGRQRLTALVQQTFDLTPVNAFRMARAAHALGDVRQANALFQRVGVLPLQQAEMESAWGDMLRERHQASDAARSYRAALEADPGWVRAHLGLARLLEYEDPQASEAALQQAMALAPEHPDVLLILAERRLAAEDRDGARDALDRLAKVRPGTYAEVAVRAAVAYADGEIAAGEALVADARTRNPFFIRGYLALATQASRAYRFADAAAYARQAVELDAEEAQPHADLGQYLMRTGDEAGARTELERAFRLDPFNQVTFNQLTLLDKIDSFVEVESGPFVFKFAADEAEVLKPYALPLADEAYRVFVDRYGFTPRGPILIEVFPRHDDFAVRTMGLPGLVGALGACFGRVIAMSSPMTIRTNSAPPFSWQATLWHEIAHVFSLQASNYRVPRWLTEGISVYEEHLRNPAWGRELTLEFARAVAQERTFGVKGLAKAFERPRDLVMAYFEASLLTEHLVQVKGETGLRELLAAYAGGAKDDGAFSTVFGKTVDEVSESFSAFVAERYGELARAMADVPVLKGVDEAPSPEVLRAALEKTPDTFQLHYALGQALMEASDLAGARAAFERAAALAPMAQGDESPRAMVARIAELQGDTSGAGDALQQLLVWDHDNVEAARRLVTLARTSGNSAAEGVALRVVADVDPFDADVHNALGRRSLAAKDYAAALPELLAAVALGPANPAEAHADVAEAYLGLGRKGEAKTAALKALEYSPTFARAQDLLLAAIGGE